MYELEHFVGDRWQPGQADPIGIEIKDPVHDESYATLRRAGGLLEDAMCFGRRYGGQSLRKESFAVRGALLARLAKVTQDHRDDLIAFAREHLGQTKADAVFDIMGAIAVLNYYAALAAQSPFGERTTVLDGGIVNVGDTSLFAGQGRYVSRPGACLALNAYNFPCWLMAAKVAQTILAGMPVVVVAGMATAALAERLAHYWVNEGGLPSGAFQFLAGKPVPLRTMLQAGDVVDFTGSSVTAQSVREEVAQAPFGVRLNIEAGSTNLAVVAPDVDLSSPAFDLFMADVKTTAERKAAQMCTAMRIALVINAQLAAVCERIAAAYEEIRIGDPRQDGITMGPLVSRQHWDHVVQAIGGRASSARPIRLVGRDPLDGRHVLAENKRCFLPPSLYWADEVDDAVATEVFGPVLTIVPYDGTPESAAQALRRCRGTLVTPVYAGNDRDWTRAMVEAVAPHTGRVVLRTKHHAGKRVPDAATVLAPFIHGGPGAAGDGLELAGIHGVLRHMQLTAVQGFGPLIEQIV